MDNPTVTIEIKRSEVADLMDALGMFVENFDSDESEEVAEAGGDEPTSVTVARRVADTLAAIIADTK